MRTTLVVATITAGLVLTGCGGSATGGGGVSGGPGTYSAEKDGVTTTVEIPTPTNDTTVQAILDYATAVGASTTYSFLTQTLKNESGGEVFMCDPRVVTNDGSTVTYKQVDRAIADLRNSASSDTTLYNQGVELENSISDSNTLPGATTTLIYTTEQSVPSVKSVTSGYTNRELMGQGCDVQMEKIADSPATVGGSDSSANPESSAAATATAVSAMSTTDLVEGFPTAAGLTKAQGFRFVNDRATALTWAQEPPLTTERRNGLGYGQVKSTRPEKCLSLTYLWAGGIDQKLAAPELIKGAAYAEYVAKSQSLGKKIYAWATREYLTASGVAATWQRNAEALANDCTTFTVIKTNGDIEEKDGGSHIVYKKTGTALVRTYSKYANGGRTRQFWISESIGDVVYTTFIETDSSKLPGVNSLYNQKANALAQVQGVTRPDLDLSNLQPFHSDPSTFVEIPLP